MVEGTLCRSKSQYNHEDLANYLEDLADQPKKGNGVTLTADSESCTVEIPNGPVFKVEGKRETPPADGTGETSLEIEIEC